MNLAFLQPFYPLLITVYPLIRSMVIVVIVFSLFNFVLAFLRKNLLKKPLTKKQISNVEIFSNFLKYAILLVLIILAISSRYSSLKDIGIVFGAFTAALGFALQKPISSIAGWIMVIIKRPFDIGDRVLIGLVKGNVKEVTMTHIYLEEVGRYGGEEISGRTVIIPNSVLFESNIINYSLQSDFILGQIILTVSFESNLEKAIAIAIAAAVTHSDKYNKKVGTEPHVRISFAQNGIEIHLRYFVPFDKSQEISSNITREVYKKINETPDVEIPYPHTKILFDSKIKNNNHENSLN